MKTCPNCGQTVADEAGFCPSCGSAVPAGAQPAFDGPFTFCPQCGEKVPAGSYACPNCGAVQPQQAQPPDSLPAQIIRRRSPAAVWPGTADMDVPAVHQHGEGRLRLPQQNRVAIAYVDKISQQHLHHRPSAHGAFGYPDGAAHRRIGHR